MREKLPPAGVGSEGAKWDLQWWGGATGVLEGNGKIYSSYVCLSTTH